MTARLTADVLHRAVALIPDEWLDGAGDGGPEAQRATYRAYLTDRLHASRVFVEEASRAR